MYNNGVLTYKRVLELLEKGEEAEWLSYFPEYREKIMRTKDVLAGFMADVHASWDKYKNIESRKDFAMAIEDERAKSLMFSMRDGIDAKTAFNSLTPDKRLELLGLCGK